MVLDDLQWCDPETLEWLTFLLQFKPDAQLLVVATLRPEEVDERHPAALLRLKLQSAAQLTAIDLGALTAEETAALAGEVARQPLARGAGADLPRHGRQPALCGGDHAHAGRCRHRR